MRSSLYPMTTILKPWFCLLSLPRQTPKSWHTVRLVEEEKEFLEAATPLKKLSEEADLFFTIGRAAHDGYKIGEQPAFTESWRHVLVYVYMVGKFSSRCAFYQTAALLCHARGRPLRAVRNVTNPKKSYKVRIVAERYGICPDRFEIMCSRLRWVWPLLP